MQDFPETYFCSESSSHKIFFLNSTSYCFWWFDLIWEKEQADDSTSTTKQYGGTFPCVSVQTTHLKKAQRNIVFTCVLHRQFVYQFAVFKAIYWTCWWGVTCNHALPVWRPPRVCTPTLWWLTQTNIRLDWRAVCFVFFFNNMNKR